MRVHLFPFDLIKKDSQIVIYGLGVLGKEYVSEIRAINYCRIKAIVDQNAKVNEYMSIPVYTPEMIRFEHNDQILIAVHSERFANEIKSVLFAKGIDEENIIWNDRICEISGCDTDIIEPISLRERGIDGIQRIFINKGFYVSGIPFYFSKQRLDEYKTVFDKFCTTNTVDNSLDQTRVFFLMENVETIVHELDGAFAELGVYQGATAEILLHYCKKDNRKLFLFDTFQGFAKQDIVGPDSEQNDTAFSDTSEEYVRNRLGCSEILRIKRGYFPESIDKEVEETRFAFVHIDCDLYKPIYAGLEFFWEHLIDGGMIVVHDYSSGLWEGASKAVNQFCSEKGVRKVLIPDWSGTVVLRK